MRKKEIGEHLRKRRKSLKVSLSEFELLVGIHRNTLYKIERGEGNPTMETLVTILNALGMELNVTIKSSI
jgi:transcriptional regulator with XRE-family HTH domain